jgi:alpha-amylase
VATRCAVYLIAHQPRRLRLPARPIPPGASPAGVEDALFDDALDRQYFERVLERCYQPTLEMLEELAGEGAAFNLAMTASLRQQAARWAPEWLQRWDRALRGGNLHPVGVDPYHGLLAYVDARAFVRGLRRAGEELRQTAGSRPRVTDTTEMWHSAAVAAMVLDAGYPAVLADGRPGLLDWRSPTHLYRTGPGAALYLLPRHVELSDDVGYRYSDTTWSGYPLTVERYARWIREAEGSMVVLGWDFETFGEHHWRESGVFDFLHGLPAALEREGVRLMSLEGIVSELAGAAHDLPAPEDAVTWAGQGTPDFFLGNAPQRRLFRQMFEAYGLARRRGGRAVEIAHWLLQSDHLHLLHWYGLSGSEAEVSAYFTPREWWPLGGEGIVREMSHAYAQFCRWALAAAPGVEP